jgi:hypothetical protein
MTKIEWEQPDEDIPSIADVLEVLSSEDVTEIAPEPEAIMAISEEPKAVPVIEPEEITVVGPRRPPVRINVEQPTPVLTYAPSSEVVFSPTLLGSVKTRETAYPDISDSILSTFSDLLPQINFSLDGRFLMIGAGFVILLGVFLLGNILVGDAGDSVVAKSMPEQKSLPQAIQADSVPATKQASVAYVEKSQTEDADLDVNQLKPLPINDVRPTASEKPQKSAEPKTPKNTAAPSKITAPTDNGKKSLKSEPEKNSVADKKPLSVTDKTAGATRPRIVGNPRP